jgi:serine/threonine protein kinase
VPCNGAGEGSYGKVYAGLNQQTGELMAVKVLELIGRAGPEYNQQLQASGAAGAVTVHHKLMLVVMQVHGVEAAQTCKLPISS